MPQCLNSITIFDLISCNNITLKLTEFYFFIALFKTYHVINANQLFVSIFEISFFMVYFTKSNKICKNTSGIQVISHGQCIEKCRNKMRYVHIIVLFP